MRVSLMPSAIYRGEAARRDNEQCERPDWLRCHPLDTRVDYRKLYLLTFIGMVALPTFKIQRMVITILGIGYYTF